MATDNVRTWGHVLDESVQHSQDLRCPNCGYDFDDQTWGGYFPNVIGFSQVIFHENKVGELILECPDCHARLWFHITRSWLNAAIETCPNWPKK